MKQYKTGIILGCIAILSTLLFTGIPLGTALPELLTLAVLILGACSVLFFGLVQQNDRRLLISAAVYAVGLFALVMAVELTRSDFAPAAIGFIPGAVLSIAGIVRSVRNKQICKTTASLVVNIIGAVLSVCSLLLVIPNGGFIIR